MADRPPDEMTQDVIFALRELPRLASNTKYAWIIKGILERQLTALSNLRDFEARLKSLEADADMRQRR